MKGLRRTLTFPVLCLAIGLVVFGVSYTMLGQGPGSGPGDGDTQAPGNTGAGPGGGDPGGGNTGGGGDPPETPTPNPTPGGPGTDEGEPGPVGSVSELRDAINSQDILVLTQTLEDGADANATDDAGNNALHWAILGSRVSPVIHSQVNVLLTHGANPGTTNNQGLTPLHFAAIYGGSDAVASALIEAGSPVNVVSEQQIGSPYELALKMGNDGVASAISRAPGHIAPDAQTEATLKAFGTYSKALKQGLGNARTQEEVGEVIEGAVDGLVQAGVLNEEGAATLQKQLAEKIQNDSQTDENCTTCEGE